MAALSRGVFYRVRVGILLTVFVAVCFYAWRDHARRKERTDWSRTLSIAYIVVRDGTLSPDAVRALRTRAPELVDRMTANRKALTGGAVMRPFDVTILGP